MMEFSIELMVLLGIGFILMVLLGVLVYQWDIDKDAKSLLTQYTREEDSTGFQIEEDELPNFIMGAWNNCTSTGNATASAYAKGTSIVDKSWLFARYKQLGWCKNIQSAQEGCGIREDINITAISLPAVVKATCFNKTLVVE